MGKDFVISVIMWMIFTAALLALSKPDKEEVGIHRADQYQEQCRNYHYGPDQTRNCMDKFMVPK